VEQNKGSHPVQRTGEQRHTNQGWVIHTTASARTVPLGWGHA
jgi:hypothetical protein